MAYIPSSSFIPKENASPIPAQIRKKRTIHVFSFVATIMLMASLVAAVGSFFYTGVLQSQLQAEKANLNKVGSEDIQHKITELETYGNKLDAVRTILDNHIAPSRIFAELEKNTKDAIQFNAFEFKNKPGFEASFTLSGETKELSTVALQKMQFIKEALFADMVVDNIDLLTKEVSESLTPAPEMSKAAPVTFEVSGNFKHEKIAYTGEEVSVAPVSEVVSAAETELPVDTATTSVSEDITQ